MLLVMSRARKSMSRMVNWGRPSRTLAWDEVVAWRPEVMVLVCCGFDEARGLEELELLRRRSGFGLWLWPRHDTCTWRKCRCGPTGRVRPRA